MSWSNTIAARWNCPHCGEAKDYLSVNVRYGAQCELLEIGENFKWGQATADDLAGRLPGDTGVIEGWSDCRCCDEAILFDVEVKDNEITAVRVRNAR